MKCSVICAFVWAFTAGHREEELCGNQGDRDTGNFIYRGIRLFSVESIDPMTGAREDIAPAMAHGHAGPWVITIDFSKGDPRGTGIVRVAVKVPDPELCPSAALGDLWRERQRARGVQRGPTALLFCEDGGKHLSCARYARLFKQAMLGCGAGTGYTTHSNRIACNTLMAAAGISESTRKSIIAWGRGRVSMVAHYTRLVLSTALQAQEAILSSAAVVLLSSRRTGRPRPPPTISKRAHQAIQRQAVSGGRPPEHLKAHISSMGSQAILSGPTATVVSTEALARAHALAVQIRAFHRPG